MKQNVTIILNNGYIKKFLKARETNKVLDNMFKKSRIIQENNGYSRWIIRNVDWEDIPVKDSEQEMILDIMEDIESRGEKIMVSAANCDENKETTVVSTVPEIPDDKKAPESTEETLVELRNNQVVVSSRKVAENFGKRHFHVLKSIENIIIENSILTSMFYESSYRAGTGKSYKEYFMNRDGFSLLVMGFTGKKALEWKIKYIDAFNKMEERHGYADSPKDAYGMIYSEMSQFGIRLKQRWDNFERKGNPYKSKLRMIMDDNKMKAALLSSYQGVARGFNEYLEEARA